MPGYKPVRRDPADNAESAYQMMWQQASRLVLLIFILGHAEGFGDLPLLQSTGYPRIGYALPKRLFIFGFCLGFGHTDSMS